MTPLADEPTGDYVAPWVRVGVLLSAVTVICLLSWYLTGSLIPATPGETLIFQNALLLIVLGSAILEHKFTKPADSVVNSLIGMITLLSVYGRTPKLFWWVVIAYCAVVLLLSAACTAVSTQASLVGWRETIARVTYRPAVLLGAARRIFSVLFLFGVFSFYGVQTREAAILVLFWGVFVVIWPLGLPEFLSRLTPRPARLPSIGRVVRTDWPNIVRAALRPDSTWSRTTLKLYQQSDGRQRLVLPLYSQVQEEKLLGTGMCIGDVEARHAGLVPGSLYDHDAEATGVEDAITSHLGGEKTSKLVGFVVEDSRIAQMRFETWDPDACSEGMIVWCNIGSEKVFYQVTNGVTREETLQSDRHGYQVAEAAQLGILREERGFEKYQWLPVMNSPVFSEPDSFGDTILSVDSEDFVYGRIPASKIRVGGSFLDSYDHHTAILGVTGAGKTELAFDLIRHAVTLGMRVVCLDLTAKYTGRLADLSPEDLSISEKNAEELGNKLFDVETGKFGGVDEKKILKDFATQLRSDISSQIADFLCPPEPGCNVGIITLQEISNTKATLYITEIYLTCLLNFAKNNPDRSPKILIVVEEAHTVMPEPSAMGLGDFDSKGLVGKIAQIALQGRKYHVGLLVIAQRTATVSKSVLTQCNTIISFTCFDDTSLKFLRNVFGESHIRLIPDLPPLHAVAFGKGLRSQRPIVFEIPYSEEKASGGA